MVDSPSRTPDPGRTLQSTGWGYLGEVDAMARWLTIGPDRSASLSAAVSSLDTFRGPSTVVHWIDAVAAAHARGPGGDENAARLDALLEGSVADVADSPALQAEVAARLAVIEALCCLPDNYRCALLLKEGAGMSVATTAALMGVSTASLRSILYRARRSLAA